MGQTPTYAPQKAMSARAKGGHLRPPLKCMTSEQFLCDVLHIGIGRLGLMCMQSKRLSADIIGDLHAHPIGHHYRSHSRGRSLGNSTRRKTVWHRFDRPGQLDGNQDQSPHRAVRRVLVRAKASRPGIARPLSHSGFGGVDMSVISTYANFNCAGLPGATYRADEVVLAAGSRTGRLLFLKEGAVAIVRQSTQIAIVDEPGAVFGEISALLDRPHTAEVRTLVHSQFYVTDAALLGH